MGIFNPANGNRIGQPFRWPSKPGESSCDVAELWWPYLLALYPWDESNSHGILWCELRLGASGGCPSSIQRSGAEYLFCDIAQVLHPLCFIHSLAVFLLQR